MFWATFCAAVAVVALWVLFVAGCATASPGGRLDPTIHFAPTDLQAWYAAEYAAAQEGGDVYYLQDTHSMEPLMWGGDYLVVVPGKFESWKVGQVLTYDAEWMPPGEPNVTHRIVGKDEYGLIMSGDNNPFSEASWRVTDANDVGIVTGIWRVKA